jgi:hypothetical protein
MKSNANHHRLIVNLQLFWQYLLLGWFSLVSLLLVLKSEWSRGLATFGVGLIVAATLTVVTGLAIEFHRSGHRTGVWLCGLLFLLLAAAVAVRFIAV